MSTIARAIELAKSGRFATIWELRDALRRERAPQADAHLSGKLIKTQLKAMIAEARNEPERKPGPKPRRNVDRHVG